MTVKELIKELNKADMNADVCMGIAAYGEFWGVEDVFFKTKEEAIEVAKKMLTILKEG